MKNKSSKARLQLVFGVLFFALMLIAEIYAIVQMPKLVVLIVGLAVLALISLYLVVDAFFSLREQKENRHEEQYENIFKSEKASYLMLKKHFEEIEDKLDYLEQSAKIPTEEIVNAQKAVAKVIIGRSKENADAIMGSNELLAGRVDNLAERLDDLAAGIADSREVSRENRDIVAELLRSEREAIIEGQKTNNQLNDKALQLHGQNLVVNLKDMELRLNSSIMQLQKVMAQAPQFIAAPMQMAQTSQPVSAVQPMAEPEVPEYTESAVNMAAVDSVAEPAMDLDVMSGFGAEPVMGQEPDLMADLGASVDFEPTSEFGEAADLEPVIEAEPIEEEPIIEAEPETQPAIEAEPEIEPVAEEKPAMPDLSDPNKPMSPDDIAALLANLGGDAAPAAETVAEEEPIIEAEPVIEEEPIIEAEPVAEEKPAMPDLSDPNKPMSPDDIAALLASMGGDAAPAEEIIVEPEPIEEKPAMPDLSDPNKPMSPDDIAALFANMGA